MCRPDAILATIKQKIICKSILYKLTNHLFIKTINIILTIRSDHFSDHFTTFSKRFVPQ